MLELMYELPSRDDVEECVVGEEVIEQGAEPDAFYVVVAGACLVKKKTLVNTADGQVVGRLQQFDHFGEAALTRMFERGEGTARPLHRRNATVVAQGEVAVLSLPAETLRALIEDGTIEQAELLRGVDAARRSREAKTRWTLARQKVSAANVLAGVAVGGTKVSDT